MAYKVTVTGERRKPIIDTSDPRYRGFSQEMKEKYNLPFTVDEIYETWTVMSSDYACSWMNDNKYLVEKAFGVKLEEE